MYTHDIAEYTEAIPGTVYLFDERLNPIGMLSPES